ncbi:hypothetical protein F4802DRAFT_581865 [Xylaria palmicola]|nr:hypothetical protein F4802DRAFT_581865 [Xylaria palmicola]
MNIWTCMHMLLATIGQRRLGRGTIRRTPRSQFTRLPPEIREMIWELLIPPARELVDSLQFHVIQPQRRSRPGRLRHAAGATSAFEPRRVLRRAGYHLARVLHEVKAPAVGVWFCGAARRCA